MLVDQRSTPVLVSHAGREVFRGSARLGGPGVACVPEVVKMQALESYRGHGCGPLDPLVEIRSAKRRNPTGSIAAGTVHEMRREPVRVVTLLWLVRRRLADRSGGAGPHQV